MATGPVTSFKGTGLEAGKVTAAVLCKHALNLNFPAVGTAACVCNTSTGEVDAGGSLEFASQPASQAKLISFRLGEILVTKTT